MTGYELNTVFRAAVTWAKKIKTETMLSKTSVSIATLAANEVFRLPGTEKNVLIIGASGKMGMTVMKNLALPLPAVSGHCLSLQVPETHRCSAGVRPEVFGSLCLCPAALRYPKTVVLFPAAKLAPTAC